MVRKLAAAGDNTVYFTYSSSGEAAEKLSAEFPGCHGIHCDFTDAGAVGRLTASIGEMSPEVLINNAALPFEKRYFHKTESREFSSGFEKNILPVIKITEASVNAFRKNKSGKIITILSSAIIGKPPIGWSEYVAGKNYLLSLSKSWATENIKFNITSNCISPSFMETRFTGDTDPRMVEQMVNDHPLKKLLTPQEVADTVFFLVYCSRHINGINLVMNAGSDL